MAAERESPAFGRGFQRSRRPADRPPTGPWPPDHSGHRGRSTGAAPTCERGAALVEFAIVAMLLATLIFATLDYGRVAKVQNQLSNSAREGATIAEMNPTWVNRGCQGGRNILDRVDRQDSDLSGGGTAAGYTVTVAKRQGDNTLVPYTGCGTATSGVTVAPGDRVVITVTRDIELFSPMAAVVVGQTLRLSRSVEVVVQG